MLEHALFIGPQQGAVIGRHQHQSLGAGGRGATCPFDDDAGAIVACGDNDGDPSSHLFEAKIEQNLALAIGQGELLGIIGQDANAVDPLVDHAVEHPALAIQIEIAIRRKRRRRDREDAAEGFGSVSSIIKYIQ
jgi:hypothetical protein